MSIFYSHVIRWTFLRSHLLLRWLLNTKLDFSIKKWNSAVIVNQNSVQNVYASKVKKIAHLWRSTVSWKLKKILNTDVTIF